MLDERSGVSYPDDVQSLDGAIYISYEFDKDGYRFLHGVALAWHKGRLYASFGHNKGGENTPAAIYHDGTFYLYMTLTTIDPDGLTHAQTAWSKSRDLLD